MGRPRDPDYWKKYRASHPEYVARERARSRGRTRESRAEERARARDKKRSDEDRKERRREVVREANKRYRARHREEIRERRKKWKDDSERRRVYARLDQQKRRAREFTQMAETVARSLGLRPDFRSFYHDPLYEDAVALALSYLWRRNESREKRVERATSAVRAFVRAEREWRVLTTDIDSSKYESTVSGPWC